MYKITYKDGSTFQGGEYFDSKWNSMPKKPILRVDYTLNGKNLSMEGYESYNHIVEKINIVNKGEFITKVILMAQNQGDVLLLIYDFKRHKLGYEVAIIGKEYYGKPVTGWKIGVKNGKPKCKIN